MISAFLVEFLPSAFKNIWTCRSAWQLFLFIHQYIEVFDLSKVWSHDIRWNSDDFHQSEDGARSLKNTFENVIQTILYFSDKQTFIFLSACQKKELEKNNKLFDLVASSEKIFVYLNCWLVSEVKIKRKIDAW